MTKLFHSNAQVNRKQVPTRDQNINTYSSIIYNIPKAETTQCPATSNWINNVQYAVNIVTQNKKNGIVIYSPT